MDSSDPTSSKPFVFKFLPDNELKKAANLTDLANNKIQETYNWKIKGISGMEILNQSDNKLIFKCDKGSFGHSYYTIMDK